MGKPRPCNICETKGAWSTQGGQAWTLYRRHHWKARLPVGSRHYAVHIHSDELLHARKSVCDPLHSASNPRCSALATQFVRLANLRADGGLAQSLPIAVPLRRTLFRSETSAGKGCDRVCAVLINGGWSDSLGTLPAARLDDAKDKHYGWRTFDGAHCIASAQAAAMESIAKPTKLGGAATG
jgi:hypothetical protein